MSFNSLAKMLLGVYALRQLPRDTVTYRHGRRPKLAQDVWR